MSLILTTQPNKTPIQVTVETLQRSKARVQRPPVPPTTASYDLITTLGSQSPIMSSGKLYFF